MSVLCLLVFVFGCCDLLDFRTLVLLILLFQFAACCFNCRWFACFCFGWIVLLVLFVLVLFGVALVWILGLFAWTYGSVFVLI